MKRNKIVEFATDPTKNFLTSFVIGVLFFTIVSDGVSFLFWEVVGAQLQVWLGIEQVWLRAGIVVILIVLLLLVIYVTNFANWFRGWLGKFPIFGVKVPEQATVEPLKTTMPGLIVFMSSKDNSSAERSIEHHWNNGVLPHLRHCWILCTDASLSYAKKMVKRFTDEDMDQTVQFYYGNYSIADVEEADQKINLLVPNDRVDNPDYICKLVNCIYADAEEKGLSSEEVIADYTGGPKGITAGIVLACAIPGRKLQYISQIDSQIQAINISYKIRPARR